MYLKYILISLKLRIIKCLVHDKQLRLINRAIIYI